MGEEGRSVSILVSEMSCAACVRWVEKSLSKTSIVFATNVNFAAGKAPVGYDPGAVEPGELVEAIEDVGYGVETRARA
jgi:Cu+-exporting ATPase